MQLNQVTVPVLDVPAAIAFYRGLGLQLIVESPHYARFECPPGGSTFSVHLAEPGSSTDGPATSGVATSRPVVYFECDDLDARVARLSAQGVVFTQAPRDERWGWREARLLDPWGHEVCLYWAGGFRRFPPWRVPAATGGDAASEAAEPAAFDPAAFAQRQLDAYNARDLERFVAEYTEDVTLSRWPEPQPFLVGRAAMAEHYRTKRFHLPHLHAALVNRMVIGRTVIDHELVTGVGPEPMNVAALYDVTPAGIARVCFFSGT